MVWACFVCARKGLCCEASYVFLRGPPVVQSPGHGKAQHPAVQGSPRAAATVTAWRRGGRRCVRGAAAVAAGRAAKAGWWLAWRRFRSGRGGRRNRAHVVAVGARRRLPCGTCRGPGSVAGADRSWLMRRTTSKRLEPGQSTLRQIVGGGSNLGLPRHCRAPAARQTAGLACVAFLLGHRRKGLGKRGRGRGHQSSVAKASQNAADLLLEG